MLTKEGGWAHIGFRSYCSLSPYPNKLPQSALRADSPFTLEWAGLRPILVMCKTGFEIKFRYINTCTTLLFHLTSRGLERFLQTLRSRPNSATVFPKAVWYTRAMRQPSGNQTRRVPMTGIRRTAQEVSPQATIEVSLFHTTG